MLHLTASCTEYGADKKFLLIEIFDEEIKQILIRFQIYYYE